MKTIAWMAAAWLACAAAGAGAHEATVPAGEVKVPPPGTYRLERLLRAPALRVTDSKGSTGSLSAVLRGRVALVSLMYTQCNDEMGCPLALFVLDRIRKRLASLPEARDKVVLASVSFDPVRDTPAVLRDYAGDRANAVRGIPWHFSVPASQADLHRLLDGYEQDVSRAADGSSAELSHVLKVFLVDRKGWVREIYSTSFLIPNVVVNDIQSLLLER